MTKRNRKMRRGQVVFALVFTVAMVAAFWAGGYGQWAIPTAIVMLGFVAAMALRDRSQTAEVVYGVGDERIRHLYVQACASAGLAMLAVIVLWYLVTIAEGNPNETLGLLAVLFNGSLIAAAAVLSRRGG